MAERRRSWTWRDRSTDRTGDPDGEMVVPETEMIVGLSLGQNYELGTQAGEVWASAGVEGPRSLVSDPGAVHVEQQGRQSTLLTIGRCASEVEQARAAERKARSAVAHAKLDLWEAVVEESHAAREVDEQDARAKKVNLSLVEDSPSWIFAVLIAVIVVGEWVLNRVPLEAAGDNALETNLLALALAVGLVAAAHLGGVGVKRSLVRANGDTSAATHHLVMAGVLFALLLAAISMSGVRVAYFNSPLHDPGIDPPWLWLMLLQMFLLTVTTLLSMAHDAPMRAELSRRQELLEDGQVRVAAAKAHLQRSRAAHTDARSKLRTVAQEAITDVQVQDAHTSRGIAEFAAGLQTTLGKPVPYARPDGGPLPMVEAWDAWLEGDATDIEEVDALVRRWRAELDHAAVPSDETRKPVLRVIDMDDAWEPPDASISTNGSEPLAAQDSQMGGR